MQAGGEVALAGNITCDDSASAPLVVSSGVSVTLDLAGFTIDRNMSEPSDSGASIISNHGTLTITDISAGQTGSIRGGKSDQGGYGAIYNDGTLTIEGGTFANNSAQAYGAILNRGNLYLSGSPSFNNNAFSDSKYEDVYLDNGAIITLDGNLDESVRVAVGSSAASSASFVITFGLPDYGSISNFVSSREGFALGTSSESSTKGEAMLGVPHGVTIDSGIANGQVSVDKEQAIAGESVKLAAEPVSGYELGSYVVTDSAGADVDVSSDGTFIMPASGVTVSAAFTFAVSWFRNYPEVGWNRIDGVDTYGHYKVRVLKADGVTPLTDWQEQVYYETDFDITDLMAEHGSGTYSVEVEAYDSDNKLIATGKSSQKAFHKLDIEIETCDETGGAMEGGNGGQLRLEYSTGESGSVNKWDQMTVYLSECEITVSTMPEKGFVAEKLYVNDTEVNDGHTFTLDANAKIKAVFKQDSTRVPATITLDGGYRELAASIANALNAYDSNYEASVSGDVVSFTVLKAQKRVDEIYNLQEILEPLGIDRWDPDCLLTLRRDYATYEEWQRDMGYMGDSSEPMPDRLDLYLMWVQEVSELNVTVGSPVCGTIVGTSYGDTGLVQTNAPVVTFAGDTATCNAAYWVASDGGHGSPFEGKIVGGTEYTAAVNLSEKFGYRLADDTRIKVNGKAVQLPQNGQNMIQARVTAAHDWDGQICKSCDIERVEINFYTSEGGTGGMESVSIGMGEAYTLPDCGFTAPAGKEFAHWRVQVGADEATSMEIGETVVATDNVSVTALYENAATEPQFKTYGLTLTGQIGLNVFMNLPEVDGVSYEGSYVEFTVAGGRRGRTVRVERDPNFRDVSTGKYYGFTLPLTSIEMAQNVSATFHYRQNGEDRSVTKDGITVENYINAWIDRGITGVDLTLAQALADYGYYVQRFLSKTNGWSLDVDYTEMETKFTTSYDKDGIRQELNYYQPLSKQLYSSDVIRVDVTLSLDSETTLDLLLTTNENAEFDYVTLARLIGGIFQSFPYEPELVDGRYRIRIDGIRAQDFDKTIMVSGRTKNDAEESFFTIEASPLGYVSAALNADSFASNYGHEAMCALYNYYLATTNYIRAHHQ